MSAQAGSVEKKDFISRFSEWSLRWIPDSMVFVLVLSVVVYFMALGLTKSGPIEIVDHWVKGFWVLLTFAMQMCVLMITGFCGGRLPAGEGFAEKIGSDAQDTRAGHFLLCPFRWIPLVGALGCRIHGGNHAGT